MAEDENEDTKERRRPRLGRGLAERAAQALEEREAQLEREIKEAEGKKKKKKKKEGEVKDTSKEKPPSGFKSPR